MGAEKGAIIQPEIGRYYHFCDLYTDPPRERGVILVTGIPRCDPPIVFGEVLYDTGARVTIPDPTEHSIFRAWLPPVYVKQLTRPATPIELKTARVNMIHRVGGFFNGPDISGLC